MSPSQCTLITRRPFPCVSAGTGVGRASTLTRATTADPTLAATTDHDPVRLVPLVRLGLPVLLVPSPVLSLVLSLVLDLRRPRRAPSLRRWVTT